MTDNLIKGMQITDREDILLIVRIAEQAEQYNDMIDILKPYIESKPIDEELTLEERNLLSVAYKNAVGLRRIAWRAAKKALKTSKFQPFLPHMEQYVKSLEEECVDLCKDFL
jgi:14-3-3 protein epsilon